MSTNLQEIELMFSCHVYALPCIVMYQYFSVLSHSIVIIKEICRDLICEGLVIVGVPPHD